MSKVKQQTSTTQVHRPKRDQLSMNPKQIRARARRAGKILDEEMAYMPYKPIEEWDAEELARGYPRMANGRWPGYIPKYINRDVHEQIVQQFRKVVRQGLNEATVPALAVLMEALTNRATDAKGRQLVPWSTKVQVAEFLVEHVVGKPKQVVETDISVKLQAVLAHAMIDPAESGENIAAMIEGPPQLTGRAGIIQAALSKISVPDKTYDYEDDDSDE